MTEEKIKSFKALNQREKVLRLREEFPKEAVGKSKARKADLDRIYETALHPNQLIGTRTGRVSSSKPNMSNGPKQDSSPEQPKELPVPAGIEELAKDPALPVRNYKGFSFVVMEGDPNRELKDKELLAMDRLKVLLPNLGPKQKGVDEKGHTVRRDPQKAERRAVRQAIKVLNWGKVHIVQPPKEAPRP